MANFEATSTFALMYFLSSCLRCENVARTFRRLYRILSRFSAIGWGGPSIKFRRKQCWHSAPTTGQATSVNFRI